MFKYLLISIIATFSFSLANAKSWKCSATTATVNPTFFLDIYKYDDEVFKRVVNNMDSDNPFTAEVSQTADDTLMYKFPPPTPGYTGYLGISVKTIGLANNDCPSGKHAKLFVQDLHANVSAVPYCCHDL